MTFIAGISALRRSRLYDKDRSRFLGALDTFQQALGKPLERVAGGGHILAQGASAGLWQGPKLISSPSLDAVASGGQWLSIPGSDSALGFLDAEFRKESPDPGSAFEHFSLALVTKNHPVMTVLATDPLGLAPVYYLKQGGSLAFSSHQTFLRCFLGEKAEPEIQAALEFLLIGHLIGGKSLLRGVRLLPAGSFLRAVSGNIEVTRYASPFQAPGPGPGTIEEACGLLLGHLEMKVKAYGELSRKPVVGLLSGGWDSRLLAALFARAGRVKLTLSTRQRIQVEGRRVAEELIAGEVAELLGVENRFIAPVYRSPENMEERSAALDHSTWFHDWAFTMADAIPPGHPLVDGLAGDILLRGLYIDAELQETVGKGDRKEAGEILHGRYLEGFNTYTRSAAEWGKVLKKEALEAFSRRLMEELEEELRLIEEQDFVTLFLLRNRTRRGIAPLPRLLFSRGGAVLLPFCDPEFLAKALSLPLSLRLDKRLYRGMLERVMPGLSAIPSTNETDPEALAPYVISEDIPEAGRGEDRKSRKARRMRAVCASPPESLREIIRPDVMAAVSRGELQGLGDHLLFLEKILILERFFHPVPAGSAAR